MGTNHIIQSYLELWSILGSSEHTVPGRCCIHSFIILIKMAVTGYTPFSDKPKFVHQTIYWLVVSTILKNISQWEGLSHILWKIRNGPNHQPVYQFKHDLGLVLCIISAWPLNLWWHDSSRLLCRHKLRGYLTATHSSMMRRMSTTTCMSIRHKHQDMSCVHITKR